MINLIKKFKKYYKEKLSLRDFYELESELPFFIKNYSLYFGHDKLSKLELMIKTPKNSLILDLGCGTGYFTKRLRNKGYRVIGLDISKKRINDAGNSEFIVGDASRPPFKNKLFDCIIASDILEHLPGPLIKNIKRITNSLKKNGVFIISVPYGFANNDKGHIHKLDIKEWESIFKKSGLKIKKRISSNFSLFRLKLPMTMTYIYSLIKSE
jgi:SAM-dependent methyltransferase